MCVTPCMKFCVFSEISSNDFVFFFSFSRGLLLLLLLLYLTFQRHPFYFSNQKSVVNQNNSLKSLLIRYHSVAIWMYFRVLSRIRFLCCGFLFFIFVSFYTFAMKKISLIHAYFEWSIQRMKNKWSINEWKNIKFEKNGKFMKTKQWKIADDSIKKKKEERKETTK